MGELTFGDPFQDSGVEGELSRERKGSSVPLKTSMATVHVWKDRGVCRRGKGPSAVESEFGTHETVKAEPWP